MKNLSLPVNSDLKIRIDCSNSLTCLSIPTDLSFNELQAILRLIFIYMKRVGLFN